ncbi:MAG: ArsR/SmtB family transcription factor [Candidatus Heimdallarchaeaceae archaeon]
MPSINDENPTVDIIYSIFSVKTKRKILTLLSNMKLTADEITTALGISRPAVEKHLKQMLEIGLIERKAETYPSLKYVYTIPTPGTPGIELISNLKDSIDQFLISLKEEFIRRLENEEQLYLLGISSKERYEAIKESYKAILDKLS